MLRGGIKKTVFFLQKNSEILRPPLQGSLLIIITAEPYFEKTRFFS